MHFSQREQVLTSCALRRRLLLLLPVVLKPVCCSGHRWIGLVLLMGCSGSDPSQLSGGVVGEMPWLLLDWQP